MLPGLQISFIFGHQATAAGGAGAGADGDADAGGDSEGACHRHGGPHNLYMKRLNHWLEYPVWLCNPRNVAESWLLFFGVSVDRTQFLGSMSDFSKTPQLIHAFPFKQATAQCTKVSWAQPVETVRCKHRILEYSMKNNITYMCMIMYKSTENPDVSNMTNICSNGEMPTCPGWASDSTYPCSYPPQLLGGLQPQRSQQGMWDTSTLWFTWISALVDW